jgi:hypothetical protein
MKKLKTYIRLVHFLLDLCNLLMKVANGVFRLVLDHMQQQTLQENMQNYDIV